MPLCAAPRRGYLWSMEQTDILVAGGGVAGLVAAAAFGSRGFSVLCVDPTPPVTEEGAAGADLRTTAILQPGQRLLDRIGLWEALAPHAAPLEVMRIVDAGGPKAEARLIRDFRASDVSDLPFGWNLPNWFLRKEILGHLAQLTNVTFLPGLSCTKYLSRLDAALVTLSDGQKIRARLAVAADGRNSVLRGAAGIRTQTQRYGQKALAFAVTHPVPHENVSTEIHRTGGPFTLVPLPDREGRPASAIVWMDDGPASQRRMSLPQDAFEAEMTERSCGLLGDLTLATPRSIWPIISQRAENLTAPHMALIAEAAHVVPPIGAQGLNMSLADTASLLDLAEATPDALGGPNMLAAYESKRLRDIRIRVAGIDMLNRASQVRLPVLRDARAAALGALYATPPVRRLLMEMGLGLRDVA